MMTTDWVTDTPCYTANRTVVHFYGVENDVTIDEVKVNGQVLPITARYTHEDGGDLDIDLTDLVRIGTGYIQLKEVSGTTTRYKKVQWVTVKGEDPAYIVAPPTEYAAKVRALQGDGAAFALPSVMIAGGTATVAEIFAPDMTAVAVKGDTDDEITVTGNRVAIPSEISRIEVVDISGGAGVVVDTIWLSPMRCGSMYARVIWQSRFGNQKTHFFEVTKFAVSKSENTDLQDNSIYPVYGYRQDSGEEIAATLRLDKLTSYDIWYYSDLIKADMVIVEIDGVQYAARIDTKSVDVPLSGVDRYTLSIDITLTRFNS